MLYPTELRAQRRNYEGQANIRQPVVQCATQLLSNVREISLLIVPEAHSRIDKTAMALINAMIPDASADGVAGEPGGSRAYKCRVPLSLRTRHKQHCNLHKASVRGRKK